MATGPPTTPPPAEAASGAAAMPVQQRYRSLEIIAGVMTVLAWVVAILGGIAVIIGTVGSLIQVSVVLALEVLIGGGIYVALIALFLFAGAAVIRLFMSIEANTRKASQAVTQRTIP